MIDKSSFCIIYYDESYSPAKRTSSNQQPKSGTKAAYEYALKKGIFRENISSYIKTD